MNKIILCLLATIATSGFAHEIEGTLMLKGSLKTKVMVNSVETTCKLKIEKIKNLLKEDSYGNPAYNVQASVSLDGSDSKTRTVVKLNQDLYFTNLFTVGSKTEVRDFDYAAPNGYKIKMTNQGRVLSLTVPYLNQSINCTF